MRKYFAFVFFLLMLGTLFGCTTPQESTDTSSESDIESSAISTDAETAYDESDLDAASAEEDDLGDVI